MDPGRIFVSSPKKTAVNSPSHFNADRFRFFNDQLLQRGRINSRHVRKAWTKAVVVWTTQGIVAHEIQMIADHHQRALGKLHVDAAGRVGQNQRLDVEYLESANRKSDFFERV